MTRLLNVFNPSKLYLLVLALLLGVALTACSPNTVTNKAFSSRTIQIKLTFRQLPNTSLYYYTYIFSPSAPPQTPNTTRYFFTPGRPYDQDKLDRDGVPIEYFYRNYFSTWSGYVRAEGINNTILFNGPFSDTTNAQTHFSYQQRSSFSSVTMSQSNTFTIQFLLDYLPTLISSGYLSMIVTNKDTGKIEDLVDINTVLSLANDTEQRGSDPSVDFGTDPAADITQWEVKIF